MSKRTLNKKSLFQDGGNTSVDPALLEIVNHVKQRLDSGEKPEIVAMSLLQQSIPQEIISGAFEQVGYDPAAMVSLFQSIQVQQQQSKQQQQEQMRSPDMQNPDQEPVENEQMQFGGTSQGYAYSKLNKGLPRPNYLPLIPEQGNILGAVNVLDDAIGSLFSGKQDESGLMSGVFRDLKAKKARWKKSAPEYYKYDVTKDPNDPNEYVNDLQDLYKGKLRTKEQYSNDILANSRMDFNPETKKYEGYISTEKLDPKLLGKKQIGPNADFDKKSTSLKDFFGRLDPDTAGLIASTGAYPEGTTLGISPDGEASSYRDAKDNPYLYNTMMGLNKYDANPKKEVKAKPFSIYDYGMNPNIQSMIPSKKTGGSLPNAQTGGAMSFDEWANANGRGSSGMEYQDQMEYEKYKKSFGNSNVMNPMTPPTPIEPKRSPYAGSGMGAIEQLDFENESLNGLYQPPTQSNQNGYKDPTVKKSQNFPSWMNQQLDRPGVNAFGKTATAGVAVANVANEMFKQRRYDEYDNKLRKFTMADRTFSTETNPVNSRGMWDVNTGLAEPDNYLPYLPAAQYGGSQDIEDEIDVDDDTLMKLIAAGADIQIV